jgi:Flp pilus assembly protein TadB
MRRLGVWLRDKPERLYLLVIALLLSNILILLLGPQPPSLSLLVATVVAIFVLAYAWGKRGRSQ